MADDDQTPPSTSSIDQALLSEILKTHDPNETRQVDLSHLVKVIRSILQNAATDAASRVPSNMIENLKNFDGMPQALEDIRNITCEMTCSRLSSIDATTMELLKRLKSYSWNTKMVLAIAAFASSIGELSMLVHHRATDPIAKSVDLLKGQSLRLDLTVLNQLLKAMEEVLDINFESSKIQQDSASMKDAKEDFAKAIYRILLILVQIATSLSKREENIELTIERLAREVSQINVDLRQKLEVSGVVEKRPSPYQYGGRQLDDHQEAKWEFTTKISVGEIIDKIKHDMTIQVPVNLRGKNVLFLISDLGISDTEIKILGELYANNNQMYEIEWIPIVDSDNYDKRRFSELKKLMKWEVMPPSKIGHTTVEYIRKEWHFVKNPIAVSVNQDGKVTSNNALPMLWTWGKSAFPFTFEKERALWSVRDEKNGWRLRLLLDEIVPEPSWSGKFVCLFGGDDKEWIQKLAQSVKNATSSASDVSSKLLVYVGKNKGEGLSSNYLTGLEIHVIESESQWKFWTRMESILFLQMQRAGNTLTNRVMQEALKVLGYASGGESWAIFSMGSAPMVTTKGEMAVTTMSEFREWKRELPFLEALRNYYMMKTQDSSDHGCINVHLPTTLGLIPGKATCPECSKEMDMFYTYRCCI